jgi:predicted DNA-binding WGR domain protein
MKREFYYQDKSSNKYWKIECSGSSVITENGRVGAKPRRTENSFLVHRIFPNVFSNSIQ